MSIPDESAGESVETFGASDDADGRLAAALSLLQATLDATADGILVVDRAGQIVSFNKRFVELARVPPEILETRSDDRALASFLDQLSEPEVFLAKVRELYADPERESEDVIRFKDGRVWERSSRPQRVAGHTVGRVWSFRDVTAQVRAQEALQRSAAELELRVRERTQELAETEHRFRTLAEVASEGVAIHAQGTVILANAALERMLGYAPGELVGRSLLDLTAPDERERVLRDLAVDVDENRTFLVMRKDGSTFSAEVTAKTATYAGQSVRVAIVRDVSAQLRATAALRASEQRFRAITESAPDAIITADGDGNVSGWNRRASTMFGYGELEIVGRPLTVLMPERYRAAHLEGLRRFAATRAPPPSAVREVEALHQSGAEFPCEISLSAWTTDEGDHFSAILRDVTERKRVQAHLVLSDRMASVGTLAAGVAHEINNPLSYVMTNLDLVLQGLRELEAPAQSELRELLELLDEARQGAERVRGIVRDLAAFSRADDARSGVVDLRRIVEASIHMVWNEIRHRARLVKVYGQTPPVEGNESKVGQVVVNLLLNAAQAIPEGAADRNEIRVSTTTDPEGRAVLEVLDTGCGIPEDARPHLFDPFYTTKPMGVGRGLGLSICHGIVTAMGGTISVASTPGNGATFRVVLPCSPNRPMAVEPAQRKPVSSVRSGRVLVIDDEPLVLRSLQRVLARNHDVVTSSSAREALAAIEGGERFDLVLCDLMMPDMSGMEFHDKLSSSHPALAARILFLTGGAFTPAGREFLERSRNPRMDKPYDIEELRALVRDLLRAP